MKKTSLLGRVSSTFGGAIVFAGAILAPFAARAVSTLDNISAGLNTTATSAGVKGANTSTDLATIIGNFISAALGLLGIILVVMFIYAGFLWMTAQGNDEKVKQAKKIISNAVIGMILIFASYAITQFVVGALRTSLGT